MCEGGCKKGREGVRKGGREENIINQIPADRVIEKKRRGKLE